MTRSIRVMFLALIAAMLAAVVTLHAKNEALAQSTQLSPSPRGGQGRGEGQP